MQSYFKEYLKLEDRIIDKCKDSLVISFDVFDTLIKRNVKSPEEVFTILGIIAKKKYEIDSFDVIRKKYSHTVIRKNPYATLHDIYNAIFLEIKKECVFDLEEEERNLEIELSTCNDLIKKVYDLFTNEKKTVIAISDMYLDKETITKMLIKCGYEIKDLFVSCECHAAKGDGSLYEYVSKKLKLNKKDWIHIGDSKRADVFGAKKAGLRSCGIKKYIPRIYTRGIITKLDKLERYYYFQQLIDNNITDYNRYYYNFGYGFVGIVVFNFTKWLIKECVKKNIKKIFFFSRDGFVLKKAFDMVNDSDIESHYLYISRRSTRVPYLSVKNEVDDIIQTIPPTKLTTIKAILELFGLNAEDYKDECLKCGYRIDDDYLLNELKKSNDFKLLISRLRASIVLQANKEYQVFKSYLLQEGFEGRLAVVDIGWNCSMQSYIENMPLMKEQCVDMYGFYLGLNEATKKSLKSEGFISDYKNKIDVSSVSAFVGLMESLFLSLEGSTKSYIQKKNEVDVKLLPYEYESDSKEILAFGEIHQGIFDFIHDANNLPCIDSFLLDGYDAYVPLKTFGTVPYNSDISRFFDFRYYSEEIVKFADCKNVLFYVTHPKAFKEDFYKARWKTGFMKRLFRIPLPYYFIYTVLRG